MKKPIVLTKWSRPSGLLFLALACLTPTTTWADAAPVPLPPTIHFAPVSATGMRIIGGGSSRWGGTAGAYGICTTEKTGYSWVGNAGAVTYSVEIGEWHSAQLRLALLPASQPLSVLTNAVTCLELSLTESTNNRFVANLALTSDHITCNLAALDESSPLGTWSLTLESDRACLRGPSGSETRAGIPSHVLSAFADPLFVYCYAPEQTWESWWGRGNYQPPADVTIKRIRISGVAIPVDERFASPLLDTNLWQRPFELTSSRKATIIPEWAKLWLCLPDLGYSGPRVYSNSSLNPDAWVELGNTADPFVYGDYSSIPLPAPVSQQTYYRVVWDSGPEYFVPLGN